MKIRPHKGKHRIFEAIQNPIVDTNKYFENILIEKQNSEDKIDTYKFVNKINIPLKTIILKLSHVDSFNDLWSSNLKDMKIRITNRRFDPKFFSFMNGRGSKWKFITREERFILFFHLNSTVSFINVNFLHSLMTLHNFFNWFIFNRLINIGSD
jgi:hypothetical protein